MTILADADCCGMRPRLVRTSCSLAGRIRRRMTISGVLIRIISRSRANGTHGFTKKGSSRGGGGGGGGTHTNPKTHPPPPPLTPVSPTFPRPAAAEKLSSFLCVAQKQITRWKASCHHHYHHHHIHPQQNNRQTCSCVLLVGASNSIPYQTTGRVI
jgi:hypothetical protein